MRPWGPEADNPALSGGAFRQTLRFVSRGFAGFRSASSCFAPLRRSLRLPSSVFVRFRLMTRIRVFSMTCWKTEPEKTLKPVPSKTTPPRASSPARLGPRSLAFVFSEYLSLLPLSRKCRFRPRGCAILSGDGAPGARSPMAMFSGVHRDVAGHNSGSSKLARAGAEGKDSFFGIVAPGIVATASSAR